MAAALAGPALSRDTLGVVPVTLNVEPSCRVTFERVKPAGQAEPRAAVHCNAAVAHVAIVIAPPPPPPARAALVRTSLKSEAPPLPPAIVQIDF